MWSIHLWYHLITKQLQALKTVYHSCDLIASIITVAEMDNISWELIIHGGYQVLSVENSNLESVP